MAYAFSTIINTHWNDEVIEYLESKFNSVNPRIIVLSKSVFINATLCKFDNVSFIINAASECLELSFAKVDTDNLEPVILEILKWDAFTKYAYRYYVTVDKDSSRSILFDSGYRQPPNRLKNYFHRYQTEVTLIGNK